MLSHGKETSRTMFLSSISHLPRNVQIFSHEMCEFTLKKALPSKSTQAKLILPKILFIRGERFLSCRDADARAFQNRDSLWMCYDMLHHGLFTAKSGRSHCIGASEGGVSSWRAFPRSRLPSTRVRSMGSAMQDSSVSQKSLSKISNNGVRLEHRSASP